MGKMVGNKTMRQLTSNDVEFSIECLPEHIPIKGNCSAIDEDTDAATVDWINRQLENGNPWAWCTVRVVARWKDFEGDDYLGACSYESEDSFKEPGGYYDDMKNAALDNLNHNIASLANSLEELQ
jgi:hypothetical protein